MVKRTIYSRAVQIMRGEIPGLKISNKKVHLPPIPLEPTYKRNNYLKRTINYIKDKFSQEKIDPRDELIKGLESKF